MKGSKKAAMDIVNNYYAGHYGFDLRLGQVFVNEMQYKGMPELFYEKDDRESMKMIIKIIEDYQL